MKIGTQSEKTHPQDATGGANQPRPRLLRAGCVPPARRAALLAAMLLAGTTGALAAGGDVRSAGTLTPEGGAIVITAQGTPAPVPVFFSATAEMTLNAGPDEITGEARVTLRLVQGRPEVLSLGLTGDGEVTEVTGAGLRDWAVRRDPAGKRFLDLRPALPAATGATAASLPAPALSFTIRTRLAKPPVPGKAVPLLLAPGAAVGFSAKVTVQGDPTMDVRVTSATGLLPIGESGAPGQFYTTGEGRLELALARRGAAAADIELAGAQLTGRVREAAGSVDFTLRGTLTVRKAGARLRLLSGLAAPSEAAAGDGWHVELAGTENNTPAYDLVGERTGTLPVTLGFAATATENGDWHMVNFRMPAGAAVPMRLEGLDDTVEFDQTGPVVPAATAAGWQGYLPGDGTALLAWRHTRKAAEGALFFTSSEQTDVRVGAGLLRQASLISFRILQGKLTEVRLTLDGPGEILAVEGALVAGWQVLPGEKTRTLAVRLSRPFEGEGQLVVRSQAALGSFPVTAVPLRLTPEGAVRHSGYVRVANAGAVRLEVTNTEGLMQLAPEQFPGGAAEAGARQIFVYRFPAASYAYQIAAGQILPEVGVSQVVTYELGETDRVINADLELDVREAPLRDWTLEIPADYAVVGVAGNGVTDHALETQVIDGRRALKLLFAQPAQGRILLRLRLEKNQPAAAGDWTLPPLVYPGAKTVRGHIGAVATPGYRIVPAAAGVTQLTEVPLGYFPRQTAGLQQAWRLRDTAWTAPLRVEARGQSVQADVFHLYSLDEGVVHGSVLINYFVVGAPATEWRVEVPAGAGKIEVTGQNVQRGTERREGTQLVVALAQPVLGAATLLVTFEEPMPAAGGTFRPGEVRPIGVQGERGYVQVVSPLQVKLTSTAEGLLKLEPLELPTEFRLLSVAPSLAAYQYAGRPFRLELNVTWYQPAETVDQVVDFARLTSQVARDGQVKTVVQFYVKTRGRKALRLTLPDGVKLWDTTVDNEAVSARSDGAQTLVPLPARLNPNDPVAVTLRLGHTAATGSRVSLRAPLLTEVPLVIGEWTVTGDKGRLLVPRGGNATLVRPTLTETGLEWLSGHAHRDIGLLLLLAALAGLLLRARAGWRLPVGLAVGGVALYFAIGLALTAQRERQPNLQQLTYAAAVVAKGEAITIEADNTVWWHAMISWWGVAVAAAGALAAGAALVRVTFGDGKVGARPAAAALLLGLGVLAQRGGAVVFFWGVAALLLLLFWLPGLVRWVVAIKDWRNRPSATPPSPPDGPEDDNGAAAAVSALLLAGCLGLALGAAPMALAQPAPAAADGTRPAQAMVQTWKISGNRLHAEAELTVRGVAGESYLLLRAPAVLTEFQGDGLRVGKVERDGQTAYYAASEKDGTLTAHIKYELPATNLAQGLPLPTGPAAVQRVTVELDQGGWEFASPMAVSVQPAAGLPDTRSGATLVLGAAGQPVITLQPKRRDLAAEKTQFVAETATLYLPGPGVVNGLARVTIRPKQGRVAALDLDVPEGFTVGDVGNGPVGEWRFDPASRRLHVAIAPAQAVAFRFDLELQRATAALPVELTLRAPRVMGADSAGGMIALGFGGDAQPEGVRAAGLSAVNAGDFDQSLLPRSAQGQPLVVLQNVFRHGDDGGQVELKIAPVAPEVRVTTRQVLSLGDDRLVLAADLGVSITRVGLFKLSFALPDGLEVEALSGPALSHWTEATEDGRRVITLHLNGRTLGEQPFALTLAGAAPAAQAAWPVPRLLLREATRQTGELLLVPEKGLRLRAADRTNVSLLDPRALGNTQAGTLAFRLLQDDWTLRVELEALEPWVTVAALQEVTLREGQTLTRLALHAKVENAAVKQLRVRLPGLGDDQTRTVHASGPAVSDLVKVAGEADLWELHFQRGIAGETDALIEFQGPATAAGRPEPITPAAFPGARQATLFVAVRGSGRLELDAAALPRGWQRADWSGVPTNLQNRGDRSVPALCFKVAEPDGPLAVTVSSHSVADALKLRVTGAELATVVAPGGSLLTTVELRLDVLEKSTLKVRLPEGARLFTALVNGESVGIVREGPAYLFYVVPGNGAARATAVHLVYSTPARPDAKVELLGPSLEGVPLENVAWHVILPPGHELAGYTGGLQLTDAAGEPLPAQDYQALVRNNRSQEAQRATALLQQAGSYLQRGDQQQAGEALARVSNAGALDAASNEDARVQLRTLRTEQAVLGLNTRRQRLYLDNNADGTVRNTQLEQAANLNPLMKGQANYDPAQREQLLMGNTAEENSALRGIAGRLVDQQLAAEPTPGAIDVTLAGRGRVLTFTRTLQVDGNAPLVLNLRVGAVSRTSTGWIALVLVAVALLGTLAFSRRRPAVA